MGARMWHYQLQDEAGTTASSVAAESLREALFQGMVTDEGIRFVLRNGINPNILQEIPEGLDPYFERAGDGYSITVRRE